MQQDIQILKQKCNAAMIALYVLAKVGEVGSTHPEKALSFLTHTPKIALENPLNRR